MDLRKLARYARRIEHIMEGTLEWEMRHGIDALVANEDWELMSVMMLTAAELPAHRMAERLLENEQYLQLVLPACFRRQIRRPEILSSGSMKRRAFRDIDGVDIDDEAGIPEHIREMAEEISEASERTYQTALQRELQEDRDGIRDFIVTSLGDELLVSADAVNAMVLISCCAVWEDTRRMAALRVANSQPTVRKLVAAGRANELVQISHASDMEAVAHNIAAALTDLVPQFIEDKNAVALKFIAENHPDGEVRNSARAALPPQQAEQ